VGRVQERRYSSLRHGFTRGREWLTSSAASSAASRGTEQCESDRRESDRRAVDEKARLPMRLEFRFVMTQTLDRKEAIEQAVETLA